MDNLPTRKRTNNKKAKKQTLPTPLPTKTEERRTTRIRTGKEQRTTEIRLMISIVIAGIIVKFGFIADSRLSCHCNLLYILSLSPTSSILCKPTNSTCHFLCTTDPIPKFYSQLLGLVQNFCIRPTHTSNRKTLKIMETRFRCDLYIKSRFAHIESD